ncbi:MAG: 1-(5-phosphoribosyl)-5-[(5-phosphoribosylamino) methylideneamino]imidazole-4-carboxamide isomerase [Anaerolineae bacterium]|nr:MAG: 1-(5-phosphoribosyl)-5-[(5-phosphoribosylamino) methylideneamino]imidazole-4-carboxamide isomerase [Anaerolineae bacterium]
MTSFRVFPAMDLRKGKVVRLAQGDPHRETIYSEDPEKVAGKWLSAGAIWIHVVDLDGALDETFTPNREALAAVLNAGARVQFGGGLRAIGEMAEVLESGVSRLILGTAAAESPELVREAVDRFGPDRIGIGIDVRSGKVRVRGWAHDSGLEPMQLANRLYEMGVRTVVHTDIQRDGLGQGLNVEAARSLAETSGLSVIGSGGVSSLDDVRRAREGGLSGVIIGRALYEGAIRLPEALNC